MSPNNAPGLGSVGAALLGTEATRDLWRYTQTEFSIPAWLSSSPLTIEFAGALLAGAATFLALRSMSRKGPNPALHNFNLSFLQQRTLCKS